MFLSSTLHFHHLKTRDKAKFSTQKKLLYDNKTKEPFATHFLRHVHFFSAPLRFYHLNQYKGEKEKSYIAKQLKLLQQIFCEGIFFAPHFFPAPLRFRRLDASQTKVDKGLLWTPQAFANIYLYLDGDIREF